MKLPDRWKYIKLSDIGNISKGSGIKREDSNSGTIPAVRYGELYTSHNDYIKEFYSFISEKVAEESVLLKKGDLLFTCSGETKEDIGKCAAFVSDCKAYAGGDLIIFSPKVPCDSKFLGFLCNSYSINKQRYRYAQGDSVVHISTESIANLKIPFPPLAEQQKIAEILCKQDKIISLNQKLLEQKQKQKKWLMQKLLGIPHTNADCEEKISLGGVVIDKSGWKQERIKDVSTKIIAGATPSTKIKDFWNGNISWMSSGEINKRIIFETEIKISQLGYESCSTKIVPPKSVLIALAGQGKTRGMVAVNEIALCTNQSLASVIPKNIDYKFLFYFLDSKYSDLRMISSGDGSRGGLNLEIISNYEIYLPTLPEQKIIAKVLSAADKEIALLKSSIEQEKQKKKSLAQLLLTGTVRVKI